MYGFDTNAEAQLINITVDSVRKKRLRLRQKLGITLPNNNTTLREYLIENINFVRVYLEENIPSVKLIEPEGTYLIWLDFGELGLENEELEDLIINKSGLWLDSGAIFGEDGKGYQRINIACPRKTLEQALNQLKSGIDSLK